MSRKTGRNAAEFLLSRTKRSLGNTKITIDKNGNASMFLFSNRIAFYTKDNRLFVTTAGWDTHTTRSRLRDIGVSVRSTRTILTLNGHQWDGRWAEVVQAGPVTMVNKSEPPIIDDL